MKIACMIPSRGRPEGLRAAIESMDGHATPYVGLDDTDPEIVAYRRYVEANKTRTMMFGDWPTVLKWNVLADAAMKDGADIFILGSDDILFETPGWADMLRDTFTAFDDRILAVGFNDGRSPDGTPHYAVSKEVIKALGYFCQPMFFHWYVDIWMSEIMRMVGRFNYAKDIMVRHKTVKLTGNFDDTHRRIRAGCWHARDTGVYRTLGRYRESDVERLKAAMRG